MSRALRVLRVQRLAPVVTVQKWAQDFRRWVGERLGVEPVERLTPSQRFQRATRISAADQLRQRPDEPRQSQSRGIRM
jgi:hypothetical protein